MRGLRSAEHDPIGYAVEKLLSEIPVKLFQLTMVALAASCKLLIAQIVKVRNRYMCNQRRVDAMDFKSWSFYRQPDIDV